MDLCLSMTVGLGLLTLRLGNDVMLKRAGGRVLDDGLFVELLWDIESLLTE